jgi:aspartate aminotransferase
VLPLRKAIAAELSTVHKMEIAPTEVLVSTGAKHSLYNLFMALLDPGDEVLIPAPYWVSYPDMIRFVGGEPRFVPTDPADGFRLRAARVEPLIGPKTRVLLVNSPNNPTGAVVPDEEFARLVDLCRRRDLWLLTDECYSHLLYGGHKPFSAAALPDAKPCVVVAGSLSKTFAMTGWRVGFALAPKEVIGAMIKLQSQSTSNSTSISQYAALAALTGPMDSVESMRREYERRRDVVMECLAAIPGVTCARPEGAFYAFPNVENAPRVRRLAEGNQPADTARLAVDLLAEARVGAVAGEAFGAPGHLRISYAASIERIREGLDRMKRFLSA